MARHRESRARRRGHHSGVFAGGATLQEPLVHRVAQQVMCVASAVSAVAVDGITFHAGLGKEGGNAIRTLEWPGEQQENAARAERSSDHVVSRSYIVGRGRLFAVRQPGRL
eukprot:4776177-Pleurochrysis_carterae.AAC.2